MLTKTIPWIRQWTNKRGINKTIAESRESSTAPFIWTCRGQTVYIIGVRTYNRNSAIIPYHLLFFVDIIGAQFYINEFNQ